MIANGEHPKVVQTHLGHSSIQVTMDRYGHLFPNVAERVAEGLEDARRAALSEPLAAAAYVLHVDQEGTDVRTSTESEKSL